MTLALLVVVPLLASLLSLLLPRSGGAIGALALGLDLALAGRLAAQVSVAGELRHALGGWGSPLGITLVGDGLAAILVGVSALTVAVLSLHASRYFPPDARRRLDRKSVV